MTDPIPIFRLPATCDYGRVFLQAPVDVELRLERLSDGAVEVRALPSVHLSDPLEISTDHWIGPIDGKDGRS